MINMKPNMEAPTRRKPRFFGFVTSACVPAWIALLLFLSGCAQHLPGSQINSSAADRRVYVVHFTASRLKDHAALASVSLPVRTGQRTAVKTDSRVATEGKPALPVFSATLTTTQISGLYQLVTKVAIREAARNKKGKLKISQRNQGALLPVRLGVTEAASPDGDPIQIAVRVDAR